MWSARYLEMLAARIELVRTAECEPMAKAAAAMAESIASGGMIYVFGCGHSAALSMDIFYRAGGLMLVQPIFDERVLLHHRPVTETSEWERREGWAPELFAASGARGDDTMLVLSTSGRNGAPVDMALVAKDAGLTVIGITSLAYAGSLPSRHSSGKRLCEIADIVVDTCVPAGDAMIEVPGLREKVGPGSTFGFVTAVNAINCEVARLLTERGHPLFVNISHNLLPPDEAQKQMAKVWEAYIEKVKSRV